MEKLSDKPVFIFLIIRLNQTINKKTICSNKKNNLLKYSMPCTGAMRNLVNIKNISYYLFSSLKYFRYLSVIMVNANHT
jgi:hypothetical protein